MRTPVTLKPPHYLLKDEDLKRIDQMLGLIHLFVTEFIDSRRLPKAEAMRDDSAWDEFEAYLEKIAADASQPNGGSADF